MMIIIYDDIEVMLDVKTTNREINA